MSNEKETVVETEVNETPVIEMNAEERKEETPALVKETEQEYSDRIAKELEAELKAKHITANSALRLISILDGYMNSITEVEQRVWAKLVANMRPLGKIMDDTEKGREAIIKKYACLNEKGEIMYHSIELPLPADAPEGMKPQIREEILYPEGKQKECEIEMKKFLDKPIFFNVVKLSKSEFLKVKNNPKEFKSFDLITKHFVGN